MVPRDEHGSMLSVHRAFVVHLGPGGGPGRRRFSGRVEHLSSGASAQFSSLKGYCWPSSPRSSVPRRPRPHAAPTPAPKGGPSCACGSSGDPACGGGAWRAGGGGARGGGARGEGR
jgi:hypothetical protein